MSKIINIYQSMESIYFLHKQLKCKNTYLQNKVNAMKKATRMAMKTAI